MQQELSTRQLDILDYIKKEIKMKGYPPSVREIGKAVGLSSSSTVHGHLAKLEKKGYIRRDPSKPRTIEVINNDSDNIVDTHDIINVPIVGQVAAGLPILAENNVEDFFPLPKNFIRADDVFILKVKGESMINAAILDGDMVIVQKQPTANNGEIVVALIENEATVKRFFKEKNFIRLQAENELFEPICEKNVKILGKVIGVFRAL